MAEAETGTPTASAPATPGTPGAHCFRRSESIRCPTIVSQCPRCKCLPVGAASWLHLLPVSQIFLRPTSLSPGSDGGTHREPEVQWGGDSDRECGMRRACGDDSDSFHRPYLRSSPQPLPHDCLRRASSLPVGASSGLYRSTSFSIHLRFLRSQGCFHPFMSGGVTVPSVSIGQAFALEFLITFNLLFVVTAVATDTRAVGELAGIAVGATVMLNILVAGEDSGAGRGSRELQGDMDISGGSNAGAVAGAAIYTAVKLRADEGEQPRQRPHHCDGGRRDGASL
ncbi:putative aquaporin NIP5-1 [Vitis vinifera]|uniref:Putative aquaporin NIP5-1 n=1 Tax=Vitis vinifera TaxID=29760 RepID=A0A438JJR9_VITVI|nr:putative aquaporin NIP5-1 [Vitis vinifera]